MEALKNIPYDTDFFWKGIRYTQVIRPKNSKVNYKITCRPTRNPSGIWIDLPAELKVKPVIKFCVTKG